MSRSLLVAVIGLVIVAVAIGLNFLPGPTPGPTEDERRSPPGESRPAEDRETTQPAKQARIAKPTFDVVRVNPEGDTVIAGRAEPGSTVVILEGDIAIGQANADERGEWVFVPEAPLEPGSRRLSLETRIEGQPSVPSESDVVLVVPEPGEDIAGRPSTGGAGVLALKVPRGADGPASVLQAPAESEKSGPLGIDVVDYEAAKDVTISGRSVPGSSVRVYLDDTLLGEAVADASGQWSLSPGHAPASGDHTLRADQVAEGGKVIARVAVPFEPRTRPAGAVTGEVVTIEPGHNLWRIARGRYGAGDAYTVIYEANRKQIKNPDLIYPGQVFTLPPRN